MRAEVLRDIREKLKAAAQYRKLQKTVLVDRFLRTEIEAAMSMLMNADWILRSAENEYGIRNG